MTIISKFYAQNSWYIIVLLFIMYINIDRDTTKKKQQLTIGPITKKMCMKNRIFNIL